MFIHQWKILHVDLKNLNVHMFERHNQISVKVSTHEKYLTFPLCWPMQMHRAGALQIKRMFERHNHISVNVFTHEKYLTFPLCWPMQMHRAFDGALQKVLGRSFTFRILLLFLSMYCLPGPMLIHPCFWT